MKWEYTIYVNSHKKTSKYVFEKIQTMDLIGQDRWEIFFIGEEEWEGLEKEKWVEHYYHCKRILNE